MGWKAAEKLIRHWKILRGDNVSTVHPCSHLFFSLVSSNVVFGLFIKVMIIRGKDKGETGTIKRVIRSQNRVIVEGKNLVREIVFASSCFFFLCSVLCVGSKNMY